jgi:hypothetical protein
MHFIESMAKCHGKFMRLPPATLAGVVIATFLHAILCLGKTWENQML